MPDLDSHPTGLIKEKRWFFIALAALLSEPLCFWLLSFVGGSSWVWVVVFLAIAFLVPGAGLAIAIIGLVRRRAFARPATIALGFVAFAAPALVAITGFAAFISNPPWVSN